MYIYESYINMKVKRLKVVNLIKCKNIKYR